MEIIEINKLPKFLKTSELCKAFLNKEFEDSETEFCLPKQYVIKDGELESLKTYEELDVLLNKLRFWMINTVPKLLQDFILKNKEFNYIELLKKYEDFELINGLRFLIYYGMKEKEIKKEELLSSNEKTGKIAKKIIEFDNIELLKYLVNVLNVKLKSDGCPLLLLSSAAENNSFDCLQYLIKVDKNNKPKIEEDKSVFSHQTIDYSSNYYSNLQPLTHSPFGVNVYSFKLLSNCEDPMGSINTSRLTNKPVKLYNPCYHAVINGNIKCLHYLLENEYKLPRKDYSYISNVNDKLAYDIYADLIFKCKDDENKIITMLEYLKELKSDHYKFIGGTKYLYDEYTMAAATKIGSLKIVKYLRENGCLWDYKTYESSAKHLEIRKYCDKYKCPKDKPSDLKMIAINYRYLQIAKGLAGVRYSS